MEGGIKEGSVGGCGGVRDEAILKQRDNIFIPSLR
jgi:hypothetical protein